MDTTHKRPLAGKVALVTGGSRGIGAAIAYRTNRGDGKPKDGPARLVQPVRNDRVE